MAEMATRPIKATSTNSDMMVKIVILYYICACLWHSNPQWPHYTYNRVFILLSHHLQQVWMGMLEKVSAESGVPEIQLFVYVRYRYSHGRVEETFASTDQFSDGVVGGPIHSRRHRLFPYFRANKQWGSDSHSSQRCTTKRWRKYHGVQQNPIYWGCSRRFCDSRNICASTVRGTLVILTFHASPLDFSCILGASQRNQIIPIAVSMSL
jgi:hypothetical protein